MENSYIYLDSIKNKWNLISLEVLSGGYTHETFLGITKDNKKLVIKIGTSALKNEIKANEFLTEIGFKPQVKLIESFEENNKTILVFEYIYESRNVFSAIEEGDINLTKIYFQHLGESIARLHSYNKEQFETVEFENSTLIKDSIEGIDLDTTQKALSLINSLNLTNSSTLIHGDFGPQNAIVNKEDNVYIIDFEQLHWGNSHEDLGCFYWTTILHYPSKSKALLQSFNEGYLSIINKPIDFSLLKASAVKKIWSALPEKMVESEETKLAWIGRLEKALSTDFDIENWD